MKKQILIGFLTLCAAFTSFGQTIEIRDVAGVALSSPEIVKEGDVGPTFADNKFYVVNVSGAPITVSWRRERLTPVICGTDQICTDESCFTPPSDDPVFASPEPTEVAVNDSLLLKLSARSAADPCCLIQKYYISTGIGIPQDSILITYQFGGSECFLNLEEEVKTSVSAFPNPASSTFNVVLENKTGQMDFKVFNILGDEVLNQNLLEGQNAVDVASLPNGVYFYTIRKEGEVVETKKMIVRH